MEKKKVLLLTNKFPYGIVETFIEAEVEYVPDDIDLTIIPTQRHDDSDGGRKVPGNIKVDDSLSHRPKFEYPWKTFLMLFSKVYRDEVKERKLKGSVSLSDRVHLAGYFGRARQIADAIRQKYGVQLSEGNTTLYSYWLTEPSYALKLLQNSYKSVTRAHRTDVYDGHCAYGTIPGQRSAVKGLDKVYVCSKDGMAYLQGKYPELKDRFSWSYLGTKDYGYKAGDNRSNEFVIASCSRLVPVKRVHLLAQALSTITDYPIHWIHIGDGSERAKVEESVKNLPTNIRVELLGNVSHEEVMEYYRDHDVNLFVNVSQSEGLPVSIMEVVSFGTPVIATDVGGTGEIVQPDVGQLIPEEFHSEELAQKIRRYIEMDSPTYQSVRENARHFWIDNYAAETNYRRFYHEITYKK